MGSALYQPCFGKLVDRPVGYVDDWRAAAERVFGRECDMLHLVDKLGNTVRFLQAAENDLLRVLADVDEAAAARKLAVELAHIDVSVRADLGKAQDRHVETAA